MKTAFIKYTAVLASALFINLSYAEGTPRQLDFVNKQLSEQMLNQLRAVSTPELIQAQAEYYRKLYNALIKSGFTKDEALKIVIAKAENNS